MLFNFLKGALNEMPEIYDSIPAIKVAFSQDFFRNELERIAKTNTTDEQKLKQSETTSQLKGIFYLANDTPEELSDIKLLNYLTEKHKGKVLYIDVWATWCGPCIEEFKSAQSLHNYFKDKDVVFINLCLASNSDTWKPSIEKHSIGGEHYFLDNNASTLFMGEHNLSGYPSYLIIDKTGGIHYSIPRPSNLESSIQKIESCLK